MADLESAPLSGIRILDLSRLLPGPYLSLVLADMGADVVKVEAPGGGDWVRWVPPKRGGLSVQFIALNRGKRSIALDLKKPSGRTAFLRLVQSADVVIESFRPGVMDRLGVGWEALKAVNERLIYVAISGYGQTGPYRDRAGHDLNYASLAGAVAMTGAAGGEPGIPGFQVADIGGGAMFGAVGVLSALVARATTGRGRLVDVSMTEGALSFNVLSLAHALSGQHPTRGTETLNGGASCYQVYRTRDNRFMSVAPLESKFWTAFCEAVDRPDWKSRHLGDDAAMKEELGALFATRTRDEWAAVFAQVDACIEPVLELDELDGHPLHDARGVFFDLEQAPGEPVRQARTPLLSPERAQQLGPAPSLGQHTRQVLAEAGLSPEEIDGLLQERAAVA